MDLEELRELVARACRIWDGGKDVRKMLILTQRGATKVTQLTPTGRRDFGALLRYHLDKIPTTGPSR